MLWRQYEFPVQCNAQKANVNSGCVKRGKDLDSVYNSEHCPTCTLVGPIWEPSLSETVSILARAQRKTPVTSPEKNLNPFNLSKTVKSDLSLGCSFCAGAETSEGRERANSSQVLLRCVKQHSSKCRQLHLSLVTPGPYIANRYPASTADGL